MQNKLPSSVISLCSRAEDMAVGCHNLEVTLNIDRNTEPVIRAALGPAGTAENVYQASKRAKSLAVAAQRTADKDATDYIHVAIDVLRPRLGRRWSPLWAEVGFVNGKLAIPRKVADRLGLLTAIKLYFDAHSAHESEQM